MAQTIKNIFTKAEREDITLAIKNAELDTSGEIRVHIDSTCKDDAREKAAAIFKKLNMHKTELRNGVLFYLAVKNRKFAIIGDSGINQHVPDGFWDDIRDTLLDYFRENRFAEGLSEGISMTGQQLKKHFPYQKGDVNELPDDISFGDN